VQRVDPRVHNDRRGGLRHGISSGIPRWATAAGLFVPLGRVCRGRYPPPLSAFASRANRLLIRETLDGFLTSQAAGRNLSPPVCKGPGFYWKTLLTPQHAMFIILNSIQVLDELEMWEAGRREKIQRIEVV
jgi:hypothetical protein